MDYKSITNYSNYIIYETGDIFNIKNKCKLKFKIDNNRFRIQLWNNGIGTYFNVPRLIYEIFNNVTLNENDTIIFVDGNIKILHYKNLVIKNENHLIKLDLSKEWKICVENKNYKISNYGDVFSITSNIILKEQLYEKYNVISLCLNGVKNTYKIHRLVFRAFKGEIPDGKVVDHIDKNKLNNHIDNLRLVTYSENSLNIDPYQQRLRKIHQFNLNNVFIKEWTSTKEIHDQLGYNEKYISSVCGGHEPNAYNFKWTYVDKITDISEYKNIIVPNDDYKQYMIDKNGNIINKFNILMLTQLDVYRKIKLVSNLTGKSKRFLVHQLVAMTFLPNPKNLPYVNHIDEDKLNNNVENLEWCDQSHNMAHSCGKKVNQIDIKSGDIINTFNSVSEAARFLNVKAGSNISAACRGESKTAYNFKWVYVQ